MATRVGKYKISKKESELSLRDGGEVSGKLLYSLINFALCLLDFGLFDTFISLCGCFPR